MKSAGSYPATPVFVRACTIEMHMDFSQELFCMGIYRKNGRGHLRGHRFVRACAVEMHMDMSQEPLCMEIYRELAGHLNCYHKNPSVWPHCLGKYQKLMYTTIYYVYNIILYLYNPSGLQLCQVSACATSRNLQSQDATLVQLALVWGGSVVGDPQ